MESSASIAQTISAPSFTAALSPTSLTIARGSTGTTTLTLTSVGGYSGTATLACGTLPAHLSCTFAPASVSLTGSNNAATSTLTIATNASAALITPEFPTQSHHPGVLSALLFPGFGLVGLAALGRRGRSRSGLSIRLLLLLTAVSAGGMLGIAGCGGPNNNAATGTYTVPVTATGASTTSSTVSLTIVVQ